MAITLTYAEIAAKAKAALIAKGMAMQFVQVSASGFDPETGGAAVTETITSFYGVRTSPKQSEVQAGLFQGVSAVILAPDDLAGGSAPSTADKLIYGGQRWDIKEVRSVAPAETVMLYKLGVTAEGASS